MRGFDMSVVVIAWVPEGIAVATDTRATNWDGKTLANDYSIKVLPFESRRMFVTLCGHNKIDDRKFEVYIQEMVDKYFLSNTRLGEFVNILCNSVCFSEMNFYREYEIIVAGYDMLNNAEVVAVIKKSIGNTRKPNEWFVQELNGYSETDAQNILLPEFVSHLFGFYVTGADFDDIQSIYINDIRNYGDRQKLHNDFNSMRLDEARVFCRHYVEKTIEYSYKRYEYSSVGGLITGYFLSAENPAHN